MPYWLCSLRSTAFNCSISVRSVFTYCAIIANQSYTKDFLNSAFKARHSNFQTFDKVNDDLYKRCLLLYFMLKKQELTNHSKKTKSTGFARTFWMFDSRRLLLLKIVQMRRNPLRHMMVEGGLNNEYSSKKTQNIVNIYKVYEYSSKWTQPILSEVSLR